MGVLTPMDRMERILDWVGGKVAWMEGMEGDFGFRVALALGVLLR